MLVLGGFIGVDHRTVDNIHVLPFSSSGTADIDAATPGHIRRLRPKITDFLSTSHLLLCCGVGLGVPAGPGVPLIS